MQILTFDVGKKGAWCFKDGDYEITGRISFASLAEYLKIVKELVDLHKPQLICAARPTRFPKVIANHSKMLAMIELAAELREIRYYEVIDSECKKSVLGKGNAQKEQVMAWSKAKGFDITEDESDALMFANHAHITFSLQA